MIFFVEGDNNDLITCDICQRRFNSEVYVCEDGLNQTRQNILLWAASIYLLSGEINYAYCEVLNKFNTPTFTNEYLKFCWTKRQIYKIFNVMHKLINYSLINYICAVYQTCCHVLKARHRPICLKSSQKKRKVFDSSKQRAEGTEIAAVKKKGGLQQAKVSPLVCIS